MKNWRNQPTGSYWKSGAKILLLVVQCIFVTNSDHEERIANIRAWMATGSSRILISSTVGNCRGSLPTSKRKSQSDAWNKMFCFMRGRWEDERKVSAPECPAVITNVLYLCNAVRVWTAVCVPPAVHKTIRRFWMIIPGKNTVVTTSVPTLVKCGRTSVQHMLQSTWPTTKDTRRVHITTAPAMEVGWSWGSVENSLESKPAQFRIAPVVDQPIPV